MTASLSTGARILLWDYARGSLPYELMCLLLLVLIYALPPGWWGDPMLARP